MKNLIFGLLAVSLLIGCGKTADVVPEEVIPPTQEEQPITPHKVGDTYGGGIIIKIFDKDGQHGLIAAATDQSLDCPWGTFSLEEIKRPLVYEEDGLDSYTYTSMIIDFYPPNYTNIAAHHARSYNGGGYSDWSLPSQHELYYIYQQREILKLKGKRYWSSVLLKEEPTKDPRPIILNVETGEFKDDHSYGHHEDNVVSVRAVRTY